MIFPMNSARPHSDARQKFGAIGELVQPVSSEGKADRLQALLRYWAVGRPGVDEEESLTKTCRGSGVLYGNS